MGWRSVDDLRMRRRGQARSVRERRNRPRSVFASRLVSCNPPASLRTILSWGWRVGFVASILVIVGLYIACASGTGFSKLKAQDEVVIPFVSMIRISRNVLLGMGARYIDGVFFSVFAVFSTLTSSTHCICRAPLHYGRCAVQLS